MLDFVINFSFPVLCLRFDAGYFVCCERLCGLVLFLGKEVDFFAAQLVDGALLRYTATVVGPAIPEQVGRGKPYLNVRKRCRTRLFTRCYRVPQKVPSPPRACACAIDKDIP